MTDRRVIPDELSLAAMAVSLGAPKHLDMRLLVHAGGAGVPLLVVAGETVADAKERAQAALGVPATEQRLVAGGRELADDWLLADCALRNGSTLQLVRRSIGGSAAARASAAMKRKKERAQLQQMMKEASSSDEDYDDLEEYPACVAEMPENLKTLMATQMDTFQQQLKLAIENPGQGQERLEDLTSDFNKLLYHGFVQQKGFYPINHTHNMPPSPSTRKQMLADEVEGGVDEPGLIGSLRRLRDNPWFKNFIVGAILVAGVNVGINTYLDCGQDSDGQDYQSCYADKTGGTLYAETEMSGSWTEVSCTAAKGCWEAASSGDANSTDSTSHCWERGPLPECFSGETAQDISAVLETVDFIILLIFTFECVLKIACEGTKPWLFCKDLWNVFDVFIVIMCYLPAGGNVAVLRLLRLARLLKLLHAVEDLQVILSGLTAGFGSIGYILILLLLVFYLFAIIANMMFAENDPVEFKDLDTAMITLFRMSTMEDWTDVMYINMYGCAAYGYGSFCFDADYCAEFGDPKLTCTPETSHAMGYPAALFFITFVVISGYVVMSLFIGVITTSMATETDKHTQSKKIKKQKESKRKGYETIDERRRNGTVIRPSVDLYGAVESSKRPPSANACVEGYLELGDKCARMVAMPVFQNMITCCILVAAVLIGCQTYDSLVDKIGPELDQLDALILFVFTLELVLKMIACGTKPWTFFFDPWNTFDFVVVFFCLMPLPGDSGDSVAVLRLLRLLRVLKLFKAVPQLQIIMSGLAQGMVSIGYIALLLTLLMYVFGIIAIMFYRANDPIHFGSLAGTFVTLFRASTFEDWTDIMFIAMYGCKQWSYGEFDFRCENNEEGGLLAAVFFILFILLSALIMLNLVIGSICSSMSDATESYELEKHRDEDVQRIVRKTVMRGYEYNLPGISKEVIYAWIEAFEKMDSATSALSLEASIHKDDIDVVLELIGEHDTLRPRSIEQLLIRANHTVPIGLVDMIAFVEALANDLMSNRIKQLAEKTGWVVIGSCDGLLSAGLDDGEHTLDPYCVVILNGEEVGRTHALSHGGGHPEWNERIGVPIELLRTTKNTFLIEVLNDHHGADSLLGTFTVSVEGQHLPGMQEPQDYPLVPYQGAVLDSASIRLSMLAPRITMKEATKKTMLEMRAQMAFSSSGPPRAAKLEVAIPGAAEQDDAASNCGGGSGGGGGGGGVSDEFQNPYADDDAGSGQEDDT